MNDSFGEVVNVLGRRATSAVLWNRSLATRSSWWASDRKWPGLWIRRCAWKLTYGVLSIHMWILQCEIAADDHRNVAKTCLAIPRWIRNVGTSIRKGPQVSGPFLFGLHGLQMGYM